MLITVRHQTRYRYETVALYAIQSQRLTPASFDGQRVLNWSVVSEGGDPPLEFPDGFGNLVRLVTFRLPHRELVIEASGTVETADRSGIVRLLQEPAAPCVYLRETPYTAPDEAIRELAQEARGHEGLETLHQLASAIRDRVDYEIGATDEQTTAAGALADGKGVCQDHTHIFISAARTLGIPARYVTGYLFAGDERAQAHHAWAEAWTEGLGWVGFDVANRVCPTEGYVRLACGLDAVYAAPIRGSRRGGDSEELAVTVEVQQQSVQQ